MVIAPPSCRDATKPAPAATSALLTAKLPLPIRPKTWRTPRPARVSPTACATSTPAASALDEGERPRRAARPADDRQRRDHQHGARRRQRAQVGELRQAILARAVHEGMAGGGGGETG